ncbi:MAG TPA: DUF3179 domain-containing protein [Thermoanaerobaculia bacterium]|nr:DUF3179 domain-containing protein [Thermoanaerobaculia bacterium]
MRVLAVPCLALFALFLGAASCPGSDSPKTAAPAAKASQSDGEIEADLRRLLRFDTETTRSVLRQASATKDRRYLAPFFELLRFPSSAPRAEVGAAMDAIAGEQRGGDWAGWYEWLAAHPDVPAAPGFASWKGELYARFVDPAMKRFLDSGRPSTIRPELIQWGGVKVDGIPALDKAPLVRAKEATYLTAEEPVFGVQIEGDARAYPLRMLDWHEMANDVVGRVPVSLAYCTLCGAGVLYRTDTPRGTLTFGSSGLLYESNKLMYDRQTGTLWNQLTGEPVNGPLVGSGIKLERLPVVVASWGNWQRSHPETRVLSLATGFERDYTPGKPYGSYFASPETMFPVHQRSKALPEKAWIYALVVGGVPKAYPLDRLVKEGIVNDELGGRKVLVVLEPGAEAQNRTVRAYDRGDRVFSRNERSFLGVVFLTDQDGQGWRVGEEALTTPDGKSLPRLPGHLAYWFGWFSFYPRTLIYGEAGTS